MFAIKSFYAVKNTKGPIREAVIYVLAEFVR